MFSLPPLIENDVPDTLQHLSALFEDEMRETHFVGRIPLILPKDVTVLHVPRHSSSFYFHFVVAEQREKRLPATCIRAAL